MIDAIDNKAALVFRKGRVTYLILETGNLYREVVMFHDISPAPDVYFWAECAGPYTCNR